MYLTMNFLVFRKNLYLNWTLQSKASSWKLLSSSQNITLFYPYQIYI